MSKYNIGDMVLIQNADGDKMQCKITNIADSTILFLEDENHSTRKIVCNSINDSEYTILKKL